MDLVDVEFWPLGRCRVACGQFTEHRSVRSPDGQAQQVQLRCLPCWVCRFEGDTIVEVRAYLDSIMVAYTILRNEQA